MIILWQEETFVDSLSLSILIRKASSEVLLADLVKAPSAKTHRHELSRHYECL